MCDCPKCMSDGLLNDLAELERYRQLMAGSSLPKRKSVYDMEVVERELFRKEVEEYKKQKKKREEELLFEIEELVNKEGIKNTFAKSNDYNEFPNPYDLSKIRKKPKKK